MMNMSYSMLKVYKNSFANRGAIFIDKSLNTKQ